MTSSPLVGKSSAIYKWPDALVFIPGFLKFCYLNMEGDRHDPGVTSTDPHPGHRIKSQGTARMVETVYNDTQDLQGNAEIGKDLQKCPVELQAEEYHDIMTWCGASDDDLCLVNIINTPPHIAQAQFHA
ncbi:hypothetical protein MA16_Dca015038 [Dendrobium catenatum]|uniref:Uncharacterized protein n=1 Tax=Dendrobium catenatum TaxID=906689 RepID=A0A2I0VDV8_9ASPA|nr:hypothetical protein MA16_Dca015038 [Dendrobium catenatum]